MVKDVWKHLSLLNATYVALLRYMLIKISFSVFGLTKIVTTCIFAAWLSIIILLSGDIHENPGPDSVTSLAEEESDLSSCSTESTDHWISMMHLNIQSIVPKMDHVRTESMAYDIMVFSESWNNLPLRVRQSESLPIFKSRLFANKEVQVGKDQEKAQSERYSHSKNRKNQTNNQALIP